MLIIKVLFRRAKSKINLPLITFLLFWYLLIRSRPYLIEPYCSRMPTICTPESVNFLDRASIPLVNSRIDLISYWSQNIAGLSAVIFVLMFSIRKQSYRTNFLFIGFAFALNGMLTEVIRVAIHRPRPFVYGDPAGLGLNISHYNSFVSGHTSFATTMAMSTLFLAAKSKIPWGYTIMISLWMQALVLLTAICRVLAGRHFTTDVIGGFIIGSFSVFLVFYLRKMERQLLT